MRTAIHEDLLPGRNILEKCERARALGIVGIELNAAALTDRLVEVAAALEQTGRQAAAVTMGGQDGYIAPDFAEREAAISSLRGAMADAVDLDAGHVIFTPHFGPARMPDLTPYRAPGELAGEMLVWLLRTVSDLAYAMGVELDMLPVNRYRSGFLNRLDQAVQYRAQIKDHPHVKIAADLACLALEETDVRAALRASGPHLGYLYLADHNERLPGQGLLDFAAIHDDLAAADYQGWLTLPAYAAGDDLAGCIDFLRQVGLADPKIDL